MNNTNNSNRAAGFLNVVAIDSSGVEHQFRTNIPLFEDHKLGRSILNKARAHKIDHDLWLESDKVENEPKLLIDIEFKSIHIFDSDSNSDSDIAI